MICPEPSIKEPCYFCYNGECYATHWWECSKGLRKPHEGKKGNKNNRYCKKGEEGQDSERIAILDIINTLEVKEVPIWEKVSPDTGQTTLYKDGDESYLERFGYRIDLKDLDKLPKNNSTHRTPADIEAAMQEVEAKSEAYTNAHRGERDDDVLSQMRGEPVSEDLDEAGKEWLRPQHDKSYANYGENKMMELTHFDGYSMLEAIEFGAKWKEEQFEKNRLKHCNSISNEQAELEQKFLDEHLDKYDRMPTFLDAIGYGMEIGKKKYEGKKK